MQWTLYIPKSTGKEIAKVIQQKPALQDAIKKLVAELKQDGPKRNNWPHYGPIRGKSDCYHCHLDNSKKYVAVWTVTDEQNKEMVLTYVGTHPETKQYPRHC